MFKHNFTLVFTVYSLRILSSSSGCRGWSLGTYRIAVNMLNKQTQTVDKGQFSNLGIERGGITPPLDKISHRVSDSVQDRV
jgi:hypothetical protein